ncbi:MAG: ABC transporter permease [Thermoflexales bacterium]|nr:ABC transporter permease [Thermoflexales bacterium]MDW8350685.1 FtsX-like permease family protein [Anaerolineae bacterium]
MFAPRWRKVMRDLWLNKTRTLLVILSIAVGVFAVGAVIGARTILARDLQAQYAATNEASMSISASDLDEQFVRSIARMPEVADAQGRAIYVLRVRLGESRSNLILYTHWDFDDIRLDRFRHEQGARTPPRREMLLERSSLRLFNKQIGDTLTVELPDGKTRDIRIAGTVFDVNAPPVSFANFGSAYITPDTLEWLGFPRAYTQVRVRVAENPTDREHIQRVADAIKKRVEDSGRTFFGASIPQLPGQHYAHDQIQSLSLILAALGVLALFLSAFLVINTTTAILAQQIKQIGIMKSIGARTSQLTGMYLTNVAAFGVISLVVAMPLGSLGAVGLVNFVAGLLNFDVLTLVPPPDVLLAQVAVGIVLPLLASLAPISTGVRITVREAITSTGISDDTPGHHNPRIDALKQWLASFVFIERWLSRPFLLSIRNTFRRKGRLMLTLSTLTLASAIFVSVFTVRDSLNRTLATSLRYWQYDIEVNLRNTHGEDKVLSQIRQVPGVVYAEAWSTGSARRVREDGSESRTISVIAPPADSRLIQPVMIQGRWLLPEDTNAAVINADVLADEPDIRIGDTIVLKFGTRRVPVQVVGVTQSVLTGQIRNPRVLYMNLSGYRNALITGRQVSNLVVVTERHDADFQLEVAQAIESHFRAVNMPVDTTETLSERREQITFQFNILIIFLLIMAALLAVVGGLGLAGTMSINVLERTREIGVMRAIGASDGAIRRIIIGEGMVIGALSWAIGIVLALPIGKLLCDAVGEALLRRTLDFAYSLEGVGIWLVAVLAVAAASSFLPAWRASRLTVREVLAYE